MAYTLKQLVMAYTAVHNGVAPDATTLADLGNRAAQNAAGAMTDAQALSFVINGADNSTALAVLSYQFFTGRSPTAEGLTYLLNSPTNPNDLGDAYYAGFNIENRYINFAANLGVQGEGAAAFAGKYGTMSFAAYVASIYETIIGATYAKAAGIDPTKAVADIVSRQDAILATAQSAGMITPGMTAAQIDLAVKAATAGYLLGEAIKADVGLYAGAANNFALALAKGDAVYGGDITAIYKPSPTEGIGQPVTQTPPESALPGYVPPPPPPAPPAPPAVAAPLSFTLTTGLDTFTGQSGDDTFTGTLNGTGSTEDPSATFNAATDVLNGGAGFDTLALTNVTGGFSTSISPTRVTNIERLKVTSSNNMTLDLTGMSFSKLEYVGGPTIVTFQGITTIPTEIAVSSLTNLASTTFRFDPAVLTGTNDATTLTLSSVGTTNLQPTIAITATSGTDWFETLTIKSGGTSGNFIKLNTGTQTSLATLNITGSAALTLLPINGTDKLRIVPTIDASTATGNITIGSNNSANVLNGTTQTVKLGAGDDTVFFGSSLDSTDIIDGGAGFDVVGVFAAVDAATLSHVSNVEALRFTITNTSLTQDVSLLAGHGLTELQIEGNSVGAVEFNHLPASGLTTIVQRSTLPTATIKLVLADGSGSADSLTLKLSNPNTGGMALSGVANVAGLETLNIVSTGNGTGYTITSNAVSAATKQVITGAVNLTMTATTNVAMNVDASAFTGKLTLTDSNTARNDTIVLGLGADTLTLKAGNDTVSLGSATNPDHVYRGADVISVASIAFSTLRFTDNTETVGGGASTSYAGVTAVSLIGAGTATLQFNAGDDAFSIRNAAGVSAHGLSKGATSHGLSAGDTIVVQEIAQNDAAAAATADVTLIQLTTQTAFTTDIKSTFAAAMGTASVTGLAADSAYLVSLFDGTKTLLAIVNTGADHAGDTTLSAADFTDTGIVLIGTFGATTPGLFSGMSLGAAF